MSAPALQRVAVRMLYDQPFMERVYADPQQATDDCELTAAERSWLIRPDSRAWCVDPLRRTRSLAALIDEFATSVAVFARTQEHPTVRLDAFFSSEVFHTGMQKGDSLAAMFAAWFADEGAPAELLALESSLARVRRAGESGLPRPGGAAGDVVLHAAVEVLELPAGTVAGFTAILAVLRAGEVADRATDPGVQIPPLAAGPVQEGILVDGRNPDPRLELLGTDLAAILRLLQVPLTRDEFVARAGPHDATPEDCAGILESFMADGIIEVCA